jgi:hypothetical protein
VTADPFAAKIEEFRDQITRAPGKQTFLGPPPTLDGSYRCTFCGRSYTDHGMQPSPFDYAMSRRLREHHRNDFGPNGYYSDEPRLP